MLFPFFIEKLLLPSVQLFTATRFWKATKQMQFFERSSPQDIRARQWAKLQALLENAVEQVPFYRERFQAAGIQLHEICRPEDLALIPPLTKREAAANFPDRITSSTARNARMAATSGTTGERMIVLQDFAKREATRAAAARSFRFCGLPLGSRCVEVPPDVCNVQCGVNRQPEPRLLSYLWKTGFQLFRNSAGLSDLRGIVERQLIYRQRVLGRFAADGTRQADRQCADYLHELRRFQPRSLKGLPAYLLMFARYIQRAGVRPPPLKEIRPMGSALAPWARKTIESAFACKVVEDYGSAELGAIACECDAADGLHLFSDLFFVEFVRGGQAVGPGELGRLLVTDLTNRAMPLIRYDIGDVGFYLDGPCSCGRNTQRVKVLGRMVDLIVTQTGKTFTEHDVSNYFYSYPGLAWFQLTQLDDRRFNLDVVPAEDAFLSLKSLQSDAEAFLGPGTKVTVRKCATIRPENGGKFRFVKSTSHPAFDRPRRSSLPSPIDSQGVLQCQY